MLLSPATISFVPIFPISGGGIVVVLGGSSGGASTYVVIVINSDSSVYTKYSYTVHDG